MKSIYSSEQQELLKKLIKARKDANLTQSKTAAKLGKSQSYISKLESGQLRIGVVELKQFARLYKKDISFFL